MYINGLKAALESQHPRLCRIAGITIALLLYADDAAIPAETPEDLQLAAEILEQFCNNNRLYVSVPKSFVTVFHAESDDGVRYDDDGQVRIDGEPVRITIYGVELKAAKEFKYLGVYINEFGRSRSSGQSQHFGQAWLRYQRFRTTS